MRPNHNQSEAQFTASMRSLFNVDQAPATIVFEHDVEAIRASLIRNGLIKPAAISQLPEAR